MRRIFNMFYVFSLVKLKRKYICFKQDLTTVLACLMERVYYHVDTNGKFRTNHGVYSRPFVPRLITVMRMLRPLANRLRRVYGATSYPSTFESIIRCYGGSLRYRYSDAAKKLHDVSINGVYDLSFHPFQRKLLVLWTRIKAFLKFEKLLEKPLKRVVPRAIQPRDPEYNLLLSSFIHPIEERIFEAIMYFFMPIRRTLLPVIMKGCTIWQQGFCFQKAWDDLTALHGAVVAIGLDANRLDEHFNIPLLELERHFYCSLFEGRAREIFRDLLGYQHKNHGVFNTVDGYVVKYDVDGNRMSGDRNTSLGTCLIMSLIINKFMIEHLHLTNDDFHLFCNGDDCVLMVAKKYEMRVTTNIVGYFAIFGISERVEPTYNNLFDIEFCQSKPYIDPRGCCRMVRTIDALAKDAYGTIKLDTLDLKKRYLHAIGQAALTLYGDIPVYSNFYKCLERSHIKCLAENMLTKTTVVMLARLKSFRYVDSLLANFEFYKNPEKQCCDEARDCFSKTFKLGPTEQVNLEKDYDGLGSNFAEVPESAIANHVILL